MTLCRHGISAVNAHTNLDCAPGGVNDVLAATLGLQDVDDASRRFFRDDQGRPVGPSASAAGYRGAAPFPISGNRSRAALELSEGLRYVDGGKPVRMRGGGRRAVAPTSCMRRL